MKRESAEKVIAATRQIDLGLGALHHVTEEIDDAAERKKMRGAIGELVLDVYEKITREVVRQFPDLQPDKHLNEPRP